MEANGDSKKEKKSKAAYEQERRRQLSQDWLDLKAALAELGADRRTLKGTHRPLQETIKILKMLKEERVRQELQRNPTFPRPSLWSDPTETPALEVRALLPLFG